MAGKQQDYISSVRDLANKVLEVVNKRSALQDEWNAGDYGNTLPDGVGSNAGITKSEVGAVAFDVFNAIDTVLRANGGGLLGNLYKLSGTQADQ